MNWNPGPHIASAWEKATTGWGKIAMVLFYSYIWLGIISCAVSIVNPASQGAQCVLDLISDEEYVGASMATIRVISVLCMGIFIYADFAGFNTKNIAMMTIITLAYTMAIYPMNYLISEGNCQTMTVLTWLAPVWIIISLICIVMEDKSGHRGTSGEHAPLMH